MKVVFACGGTAGHINPAIAIAHILKKAHKDIEIFFFGRPNSMESELIAKENYAFYPIDVQPFKKEVGIKNVTYAKNLLRSYKRAKTILKELSPVAVIGTGGYVCYPVLRAAVSLKIPTAVHESNAIAGKSVTMLAKKCDQTWLGFESACKKLKTKKKTIVTGNPLREGFFTANKQIERAKLGLKDADFFILSFGGSGGAMQINRVIQDLWKMRLPANWHFLHVCGNKYQHLFKEIKAKQNQKW